MPVNERALDIPTAEVFIPLLKPARYKGAFGGRGSGKSHFFAGLMVDDALAFPGDTGEGLRGVCIREVQKDLSQSAKLLIEDKLVKFRVGEADGFKVFKDCIETPKDGLIIFKGMNNYTADSIKSLEGFQRAWWEEAHTATATSLELLRPTIRAEGKGWSSELWFSWNPRRKSDPVDSMFRGPRPPTGAISVEANWRDNPWFPKVLEQERKDCLRDEADRYPHIWDGKYATAHAGSYFGKQLAEALLKGRITDLALDPLMEIKAFWDLGGAGAVADAMAIWIVQFVGERILVFDYIEGVGQTLGHYVTELRKRGWGDAHCYLPHDGINTNSITGKKYKTHLEEAGFVVDVVKNQGKGAAMQRVEAARRLFPKIWFNESTTEPGRDALGWYHEKLDETRQVGLGPEHDWSSHGSDAFGLMCIVYRAPRNSIKPDNVETDVPADPLVNY